MSLGEQVAQVLQAATAQLVSRVREVRVQQNLGPAGVRGDGGTLQPVQHSRHRRRVRQKRPEQSIVRLTLRLLGLGLGLLTLGGLTTATTLDPLTPLTPLTAAAVFAAAGGGRFTAAAPADTAAEPGKRGGVRETRKREQLSVRPEPLREVQQPVEVAAAKREVIHAAQQTLGIGSVEAQSQLGALERRAVTSSTRQRLCTGTKKDVQSRSCSFRLDVQSRSCSFRSTRGRGAQLVVSYTRCLRYTRALRGRRRL